MLMPIKKYVVFFLDLMKKWRHNNSNLIAKVRILAEQNNISVNRQLIELIEFGIKYFLEKTNEFEMVKLKKE